MSLSPTLLLAVMEIAATPLPPAPVADTAPTIAAVQTVVRKQPTSVPNGPVRDFPAVEHLATPPATASAPTAVSMFPETGAPTAPTTTAGMPTLGPNDLLLTDCMVGFDRRKDATIGANLQGRLMELRVHKTDEAGRETVIPVREGLVVKADEVLGYQDDRTQQAGLRVAQSKLAVAEAEAKKDLEVQYASDTYELDSVRVEKYQEAVAKVQGAISDIEIREAILKKKQSITSYHLAKYNLEVVKKSELEVAKEEVAAAEVAIERHRLIAPFDGLVIDVKRAEGEWLREGDPIVQIVQIDTLIISKKVALPDVTPDMLEGRPVTVHVSSGGKSVQLAGRVYFASPETQADGFKILIEVENRQENGTWQLRKGIMVNAVIHLAAAPGTPKPLENSGSVL